jgi:hypothetical protein|tara:strand:- start:89 stop:304 length:216 start_codon:yes stop_codon:yes gene_type:complete
MVVLGHVVAVYAALIGLGEQFETIGVLPVQGYIVPPLYVIEDTKLQGRPPNEVGLPGVVGMVLGLYSYTKG